MDNGALTFEEPVGFRFVYKEILRKTILKQIVTIKIYWKMNTTLKIEKIA
jgi:hypothetical protein